MFTKNQLFTLLTFSIVFASNFFETCSYLYFCFNACFRFLLVLFFWILSLNLWFETFFFQYSGINFNNSWFCAVYRFWCDIVYFNSVQNIFEFILRLPFWSVDYLEVCLIFRYIGDSHMSFCYWFLVNFLYGGKIQLAFTFFC